MLRRIWPVLLTLTAMLLDTSVIPVFYHGAFTVPLTFPVVMCIALCRGNLMGLLYGMIGGLLIDITTGTLGIMTFFFMVTGFFMGLIIDRTLDESGPRLRRWLRRGLVSFLLFLLGEIVFVVYRFFVTNTFEWLYLRDGLIRSLIAALLTLLLYRPLKRLLLGPAAAVRSEPDPQEVKHF